MERQSINPFSVERSIETHVPELKGKWNALLDDLTWHATHPAKYPLLMP